MRVFAAALLAATAYSVKLLQEEEQRRPRPEGEGEGHWDEEIDYVLELVDADNDGEITRDEHLDGAVRLVREGLEEEGLTFEDMRITEDDIRREAGAEWDAEAGPNDTVPVEDARRALRELADDEEALAELEREWNEWIEGEGPAPEGEERPAREGEGEERPAPQGEGEERPAAEGEGEERPRRRSQQQAAALAQIRSRKN